MSVPVNLMTGDSLRERHLRPTLILSNPPFGFRSQRGRAKELLLAFAAVAGRVLAPSGRLVWISPFPEETAMALRQQGLRLEYRQAVGLGGLKVEIQRFDRP